MEVHGCGFGTGWTSLPSLYFPVAMSSLLAGERGGEGSPSLSLSPTSHETAVSTPASGVGGQGRASAAKGKAPQAQLFHCLSPTISFLSRPIQYSHTKHLSPPLLLTPNYALSCWAGMVLHAS